MTTGREKRQCPFVRGLKKMELHKVTKLVSGRTGIQDLVWCYRSYHALHSTNLT